MRFILTTLALAAAICACDSRQPPDRATELRALRNGILADRYRDLADCQATAIEFNHFPEAKRRQLVAVCMDTHRVIVESGDKILRNLDAEIERLERERR